MDNSYHSLSGSRNSAGAGQGSEQQPGAFNNDQMQGALGAEGSDETTGSGNKSSLQAMDDAHGTASGFKRSEGEASDRRAEGSEHHLSGGPSAAAKETGGGNPLSQEGWTEGGSNQGKMGGDPEGTSGAA